MLTICKDIFLPPGRIDAGVLMLSRFAAVLLGSLGFRLRSIAFVDVLVVIFYPVVYVLLSLRSLGYG